MGCIKADRNYLKKENWKGGIREKKKIVFVNFGCHGLHSSPECDTLFRDYDHRVSWGNENCNEKETPSKKK